LRDPAAQAAQMVDVAVDAVAGFGRDDGADVDAEPVGAAQLSARVS